MRDERVICDRCGRDASEKLGGEIELVRLGKRYDLCKHCAFDCKSWVEAHHTSPHVGAP